MSKKRRGNTGTVIMPAPTPAALEQPPDTASKLMAETPPVVESTPVIVQPKADVASVDTDGALDLSRKGGSYKRAQSFLCALLCRHAYAPESDATKAAIKDLLGLTFIGRYNAGSDESAAIDRWLTPGGRDILAFRGEKDKRTSFGFIKGQPWPRMVTWDACTLAPRVVDTLKAYATGAYTAAAALIDQSQYFNSAQVIVTGHAAGGNAAYAAAILANQTARSQHPGAAGPVCACVTFGMWPFLTTYSVGVQSELLNAGFRHFRNWMDSDPVYDHMRAAAALGFSAEAGSAPYADGDKRLTLPQYATVDSVDYLGIHGDAETDHFSWVNVMQYRAAYRVAGPLAPTAYNVTLFESNADSKFSNFFNDRSALEDIDQYPPGKYGATSYSQQVERVMRDVSDTPYPLFTKLVQASRMLDAVTVR